jgi:2-phosphosulfolactate phosphatase
LGAERHIRICLSPALYPLYREENSITVVVDILRASSAICAALQHGVKKIIPVADLDEALQFEGPDVIRAAERGGEVVSGFRFGNSPTSYIHNPEIAGKTLVLSTTNGTQAIAAAKGHGLICIGAFSNITSLSDWLIARTEDVMILCAGWKSRFNLEDTIFCGALAKRLVANGFQTDIDSDATLAALVLYEHSKGKLGEFLKNSSHHRRLNKLNLQEDISYCLQEDTTSVVPVLLDDALIDVLSLPVEMNR